MNTIWSQLKNDESFLENFYYIEYNYFKFLNNSSNFLQMLSIYNLLSPVLTLIMPILMLIVPFFMLKMGKINITFTAYVNTLKIVLMKNPIFKLFTMEKNVPLTSKLYSLITCAFYVFSLYNSANICYRFYKNYIKIRDHIDTLKDYLKLTISNIDHFLTSATDLNTFKEFNDEINKNKNNLTIYLNKINKISRLHTVNNIFDLGYVMKIYYELYNDKSFDNEILFSFGFQGYFDQMIGLSKKYKEKKINTCKFSEKNKMKKMYYPPLINKNPVKNDIDYKKNIIITGPNASGKTTIIKTVLTNLLLSHINGVGFYEKASITLYDSIYCYLNIPDTSGRDSLFQAEARRCKEIINSIKKHEKYFCIFDELYSGTNPYEAIASADSFINYLSKFNIDLLLTTHYIELCEIKNEKIKNCYMQTERVDDYNFIYNYKLMNGISKIKGGLKVLLDLDYPLEILEKAQKNLLNM